MQAYGVRNLELSWFTSYLSQRAQISCFSSCQSDPATVSCGAPQGSILGPLLFILYVNDLPQCFTQCQVNIYADDTAFYVAKRTVQEVNVALQSELHGCGPPVAKCQQAKSTCRQNRIHAHMLSAEACTFTCPNYLTFSAR